MKPQTPLMQQYWSIKSAHEDKILLFRMGDFFEMFFEDAVTAAPILGIALTSRNKKAADETPMCGVPHHSIGGQINKLLARGYKVALCDQIEDPKLAKGIVKRAVTRVLTPGMVFDYDSLNPAVSNYISCWEKDTLAFIETSTGESFYFRHLEPEAGRRILDTLGAVEIVQGPGQSLPFAFSGVLSIHEELMETSQSLPSAAARLLSYVKSLSSADTLSLLKPFEERSSKGRMELSLQTIKHLEIFKSFSGEEKGSFFESIDRTKTSGGARLLRQKIAFPLLDLKDIQEAHDRIQSWIQKPLDLKELRSELAQLGDLERRFSRLGQAQAGPRDLLALADSIEHGLKVFGQLGRQPWGIEILAGLSRRIQEVLVEEPPVQLSQGGFIRKGFTPELDEQIELSTNAQNILLQKEAEEKERSGINNLKIRFNGVFGYYIEITKSHLEKVPSDYLRKQTLATAERYSTQWLMDLEQKILAAQSRRLEIEQQVFAGLKTQALGEAEKILKLAQLCSELDVETALAHLALERSYCRPVLTEGRGLRLLASRHPVVEQTVRDFVPNDFVIDRSDCLLLTGPNMAGKSTLMRQVALIQILAQMGSFVPAAEAHLSVCEQIFTRIGASDNLSQGLSTFMVEMTETAEMIRSAGPKSLLILDEVGRGTSTYDGLSLAQALLEYIIGLRVNGILFATHYHELTLLSSQFPQIKNAHMSVVERKSEIHFLHTLKDGPALKSYGIQVAQLAGVPKAVTSRALEILQNLEAPKRTQHHQMSIFDQAADIASAPADAASDRQRQLFKAIQEFELDQTTPLQAMLKIAEWKKDIEL